MNTLIKELKNSLQNKHKKSSNIQTDVEDFGFCTHCTVDTVVNNKPLIIEHLYFQFYNQIFIFNNNTINLEIPISTIIQYLELKSKEDKQAFIFHLDLHHNNSNDIVLAINTIIKVHELMHKKHQVLDVMKIASTKTEFHSQQSMNAYMFYKGKEFK